MFPPAPSKAAVLDVPLSLTSHGELCRLIHAWGAARAGAYVCVCNVHTVMEAADDPTYADVLRDATVATPDGTPLVWTLRALGHRKQTRVYGPDLLLAFADYGARMGVGQYFYGGAPGVALTLAQRLGDRFPGFRCVGVESPPYRELTPEEDAAVVERIHASGADVVWVGLGAPKQERWIAAHAGRIGATLVGVGAAFDFHAGTVRQAPRWMMRLGLEWLFRLAVEPGRLWKRYAWHNPRFLCRAMLQCLRESGRARNPADDDV